MSAFSCVQAYEEYFKHLDKAGGFFYERWGDAPVHSLGAVMLLNSTEVPSSPVFEVTLDSYFNALNKIPSARYTDICVSYMFAGERAPICPKKIEVGDGRFWSG